MKTILSIFKEKKMDFGKFRICKIQIFIRQFPQ